jgi:hypothetical protein
MNLIEAQADLRRAHVNGGAGVLVSGLVWLASGLVWLSLGAKSAFVVLFFGGIAIAPLAQLVTRLGFKAPASGVGKRLEWIALATVPIILAGFYLAWRWPGMDSPLAIPLVAMAVGLRYLTFPVMFGERIFLLLGGAFITLGALAYQIGPFPFGNVALILGLAELGLGYLLCRSWRRPAASI